MISVYAQEQDFPFIGKIKAACLSTDTKPTVGIDTGESLLEIDTGNVYLYNADATTWYLFAGSESESESGSESESDQTSESEGN